MRSRGFTLVELLVALVLFALLSSLLFGSLYLAGQSWDKGEAKVEESAGMRLTEAFLRDQLESQHPLRMRKIVEFPLVFAGEPDELTYAAPLPTRIAGGGIWAYRLAIDKADARSPLVLQRAIPDVNARDFPGFGEAERSVLAQDITELKIGYFGRDNGAGEANEPHWRDRWDDRQRLPMLIRIDVVPKQGQPWPTLIVAPRESLEAGCRAFDSVRVRCVAV